MQTHTALHRVDASIRIATLVEIEYGIAVLPLVLAALTATAAPAGRVVLISIDGLRADAIERLGAARTPALHRLLREGAATLNARSDPTWTYTMPNHVCMVTGRLAAGADGHGYQENTFEGISIHQAKHRYVASVFDVVHDGGYRTAMVSSKPKFALFSTSYAKKIDQATITEYDDARSIEAALSLLGITTPPRFIFLHLAGTDLVGHSDGFDVSKGSRYLDEVERQDGWVGRILFAIGARGSLTETTAIILTSDHGGDGPSHGDPDRLLDYRVPLLVWGAGAKAGADLYALNPERADPGDEKAGARPPIRNCDAGNLALSLLHLPPIPGSMIDASQDLSWR